MHAAVLYSVIKLELNYMLYFQKGALTSDCLLVMNLLGNYDMEIDSCNELLKEIGDLFSIAMRIPK